jgi:NAD-dependent dihydropyrimidine dehydrogenase PreA subunit
MQKESYPIINYNLCTKCGICVNECPVNALEMTPKGPVLLQPFVCTYCTDCEEMCPTGAIRTPFTITWQ